MTAALPVLDPACLPYRGEPGRCDWCGAALTGRARRWCREACFFEFAREHIWGWARPATLRRDGKCVRCGSTSRLEVDHIRERHGQRMSEWSCIHHGDNLRTLCHDCHVTRRTWDPTATAHLRQRRNTDPQEDQGLFATLHPRMP